MGIASSLARPRESVGAKPAVPAAVWGLWGCAGVLAAAQQNANWHVRCEGSIDVAQLIPRVAGGSFGWLTHHGGQRGEPAGAGQCCVRRGAGPHDTAIAVVPVDPDKAEGGCIAVRPFKIVE